MTSKTPNRAYVGPLNRVLRPPASSGPAATDLFAGAGGLSLGFRAKGFSLTGYESNATAAKTYEGSIGRVVQTDLALQPELPPASVILAGPPCQPWSRAGKGLGAEDSRDGLRIVADAIRQCRPLGVLVENVPEMARPDRRAHLDDFEGQLLALGYTVVEQQLNAASFGVPQNRRRVFVAAVLGAAFEFPDPVGEIVNAGHAIGRSARRPAEGTQFVSPRMDDYIARYEAASKCRTPRDLTLDRPARTLTVRNLSGATGDMMRVKIADGRRRTLTVREAARLQSFPDWFRFHGSRRQQLEQIGNAVPPLLSYHLAESMLRALEKGR